MTTESLPLPRAIHDFHLRPSDTFYRIVILPGFAIVVLAGGQLQVFRGLIHSNREYGWLGYIARPTALWAGMGMLMLLQGWLTR